MGGSQLIVKNMEFIRVLPAWAQEFSYKYCSQTANLYFLYGNIRDFLPHKMNEGDFLFVKIQKYISEVLFDNKDIIIFYDRSSGVTFCTPEMEREYIRTMALTFPEAQGDDFVSSDPEKSFFYLEKYFTITIPKQKRIVLIIDYAETIVPAGDISQMDDADRFCLVTLNRWAHEPEFTEGDVSIILLTENITDISPKLAVSPSTIKVEIPFPDEQVRILFLKFLEKQGLLILERGVTPERLGPLTAGLNLLNMNQLAALSYQAEVPISLEYLKQRKKEIIEKEACGLLEFLETEHDLSYISGHDFVKKRFKRSAKAIKQGRLDVLPMGYLISGPIGTGKSFMVSAFAGEIGIPMVQMKNFRSKWQGATESNLEKVLSILKAMAPVAVMVDEADAFLGDRNSDGDSGTSSRVFAQIASFMGNTEYRGKIIWFLITCRPDLLPIDLKRQGRAEEHLALFYPETLEEKEALVEVLQKKLDIKMNKFPLGDVLKKMDFPVSGADIEAVLVRAKMNASVEGRVIVTREDLEETIKDFIPPSYPYEIELQNLVAVLECTSREMVPAKYRKMDRSSLAREIQELKQLLGDNQS